MNYYLNVVNIKSHGCAHTICSSLDALDGVHETVVNVTNGAVIVEAGSDKRDIISTKLLELGYPEAFQSKIKNSLSIKAKSFISCVKGRLSTI